MNQKAQRKDIYAQCLRASEQALRNLRPTHAAFPHVSAFAMLVQELNRLAQYAEREESRRQAQLDETHAERVHDNTTAHSTIDRMKTEYQVLYEAHTRLLTHDRKRTTDAVKMAAELDLLRQNHAHLLDAAKGLLDRTYLDSFGDYHYLSSSDNRDIIRKALEYIKGAAL